MAAVADAPWGERCPQSEEETRELLREALQDMKALKTMESDSSGRSVNEQAGAVLDDDWYELLQQCIDNPGFLLKLDSIRNFTQAPAKSDDAGCLEDKISDEDLRESYIVVSREDAVESMALLIATTISKCPEADKLTSKELQKAVVRACKDLKTSKLETAWLWSKFLYKIMTYGYNAFQVFENPWLVRAVAAALWSLPKTMSSLFV